MTEPFRIPNSWCRTKLGKVVAYGKTKKAEPTEIPDDAWLLELEDVERDTSRILQRLTAGARKTKSTKNRFASGDVLYGKLRPYLNKILIADEDGYCSTEIIPIKTGECIESGFLYHWLRSREFRSYVDQVCHGVNMPRLGTTAGQNAPFVLPPLNEQRRIVSKIEDLTARSRTAREALEAIPPLLERFRQSVLAAAFRGDLTADWRRQNPDVEPASTLLERIRQERRHHWEETELAKMRAKGKEPKNDNWKAKYKEPESVDSDELPELPQGWCWLPLGAFCRVQGGNAFKSKDYRDDGIPLIRISNLAGDGQVEVADDTAFLDPQMYEEFPDFRLQNGDILIAMSGATTGKTARYNLDRPALLNQRVGRFLVQCPSSVSSDYVANLIDNLSGPILKAAYGGAQPNISGSKIEGFLVPVPPLVEQQEITTILEQGSLVRNTIKNLVALAAQRSEALTQSILAKAFRGELVPQNPDDEPASALLERIRLQENRK